MPLILSSVLCGLLFPLLYMSIERCSVMSSYLANNWGASDDPEVFHGMSIGLQILGRRLEEEKVLAVAEEVRRCLFL